MFQKNSLKTDLESRNSTQVPFASWFVALRRFFANSKNSEISASPADDLSKLEDLHNRGVLSDEEFQRAKQKALAA